MNQVDDKKKKAIASRVLFVLLLASFLFAIIAYGIYQLYKTDVVITVSPTLNEAQQIQINSLHDRFLVDGNVTDMHGLQKAVEQLPWVSRARIHRNIGSYLLDIQMFVPVARLNDRWFLSYEGKRKDIYDDSGYTDLVRYQFDPQKQQILLPRAQKLQKKLQSIKLTVRELRVSPVGNWSVVVEPEITINFGINKLNEKANRLTELLPDIKEKGVLVSIDLRNERGVAVRYDEVNSQQLLAE